MAENEKNKLEPVKDGVTETIGILEELASALVMALLIIGFVVQPFIIPTGSMAETLKGLHFRQRCRQCGYRYDRNFESGEYGFTNNRSPWGHMTAPVSRCPSCGYYNDLGGPVDVARGDKILAIKCLYNFFEPKRWDVVVFKNPAQPSQNYIKRLVGRPGEAVEIIDGDIYINGEIARKPPKVQNELWMVVYDSKYVPALPEEPYFNNHEWEIPLQNYGSSQWKSLQNGMVSFELNSSGSRLHRLVYDTSRGNDFRATYAYDPVDDYELMPKCSDLKVCFEVEPGDGGDELLVGASLRKYQQCYKAQVSSSGRMYISRADGDSEEILSEQNIELPNGGPVEVEFSNVDHLLSFEVGFDKLEYDLGRSVKDAGKRRAEVEPEVEITGAGKLRVYNVGIYRDIHYTSKSHNRGLPKGNGVEGRPIKLKDDEFFVLGDNSPASLDGRWWPKRGIGNNAHSYSRGIVPRDYLVGKAFAVFWPSGYKPFKKFPLRIVPDVKQIRLIYGGSSKSR